MMQPTSFPEFLRSFRSFLNDESRHAEEAADALLSRPPKEWAASPPLPYGALNHLLGVARREFDRQPTRAITITDFVLRHVHRVYIPPGCDILRQEMLGRAWKEYGNALYAAGRWQDAYRAAHRSVRILSAGTLLVERTAAQLLLAMIEHGLGREEKAKSLLRECQATFERLGETRRLVDVANLEGAILFRSEQYASAHDRFLVALAGAGQVGDERERARILNNLGHCAVQLERFDEAITHFHNAWRSFDREGMTAERQRVFWGLAALLRRQGHLDKAIEHLQRVRHEFLVRGSIVDAAHAGLRLIELLDAIGAKEQVTSTARELVEVFSNAGIQPDLGRALAWLEDRARLPSEGSLRPAMHVVYDFLQQLAREPEAAFQRPPLDTA